MMYVGCGRKGYSSIIPALVDERGVLRCLDSMRCGECDYRTGAAGQARE